jgi:alpha-ribazole phosphatase
LNWDSLNQKLPTRLIFLLCHGDIGAQAEKRYIGQTEYNLSPAGYQQAELWRQNLAVIPFSEILASDLQRTRQTARIINDGRQLPLHWLPSLREISLGQWEDRPFSEIQELYPQEYTDRGDHLASFRPPAGESFSDLQKRVWNAVRPFLDKSEGHTLIVSHAGVNRVIIGTVLGLSLDHIFRFRQDYGGLSILAHRAGQLTLQALNLSPGCL